MLPAAVHNAAVRLLRLAHNLHRMATEAVQGVSCPESPGRGALRLQFSLRSIMALSSSRMALNDLLLGQIN